MDKLAPVIKHHFWILFGIALLLPPIGWWMTTSELAASITSRRETLDQAFGQIPSDSAPPNEDWKHAADDRIANRKEQNRLALERLWKSQTDLMVWSGNVKQYMPDCPYRGDHPDPQVRSVIPSHYRDDYELEINRLWLLTEPIQPTAPGARASSEPNGKVLFPLDQVPRVSKAKWSQLPPTWREIWNAQEDIWLLSQIFTAVRNVNAGTTSITDSNIRQIMQVQLFGGSRAPASDGGAAGGAASGFPTMSPMGGARTGGAAGAQSADFPMTEEYTVADTLTGGTGGGGGGFPGSSMTSSPYGPGGPEGSGAAAATDPNADDSRYVAKEVPYRSRGFRIKVAIHQMRVPDFIKELLNSDYATEITRYQWAVLNPEEPDGSRSRTISLPGAGGGYPGGGYPGASPSSEVLGPTSTVGYPGEGGDEGLTPALDSTTGPGAYQGPGGAAGARDATEAALGDPDLVELVITGEMYIYNPPEPVAVDPAAESADPNAVAETAGGTPVTTPAPADSSLVPAAGAGTAVTPVAVLPAGAEVIATPAGTAPAGTAPTGTAPTGTAPAGTAPTGTAPAGTAPTGAAPAAPAGTNPAAPTESGVPAGTGGTSAQPESATPSASPAAP